jgi:hypothetical protein
LSDPQGRELHGTPLSAEKIDELLAEDSPVKERGEPLKLAALATHGYLDEDGEILYDKLDDVLVELVTPAVVYKRGDRKSIAITRTTLTKGVFPNMPGPGEYEETGDPEASEWAWGKLNEMVWRRCDSNEGKPVQSRLNGATGMLLCRTWATSEKGVQGVYVTRDWECIREDFIRPDQKRIENAIDQASKNAAMGAERLPEFGKSFRTQLNKNTKDTLRAGVDKLDLLIESGSADSQQDGE